MRWMLIALALAACESEDTAKPDSGDTGAVAPLDCPEGGLYAWVGTMCGYEHWMPIQGHRIELWQRNNGGGCNYEVQPDVYRIWVDFVEPEGGRVRYRDGNDKLHGSWRIEPATDVVGEILVLETPPPGPSGPALPWGCESDYRGYALFMRESPYH